MVTQKRHPNWILRSMFCVSLVIHLVVLGYISGHINSKILTRIELTICDMATPNKRSIPRPRKRIKPPAPTRDIQKVSLNKSITPALKAMKAERIEYDQRKLEEQINVPYIAPEPSTKTYNRTPPSMEATGENATSNDYLAMVRSKIEQHKKYPPIARIKQKQGKVIIRFVITLEGTVRTMQIIKSSGHVSLDEAGLEAIKSSTPFPRPPAKLFKREIPIELPIIFELT